MGVVLTFEELLEDLQTLSGIGLDSPELLIATRRIAGVQIENPTEVQLRELGKIEIDENDQELKLVPRMISGAASEFRSPVTVATLQEFGKDHPQLLTYEVFTVDRRGLLDDESTVSLNLPLLGVCGKSSSEIWILQPPQDQWPNSWFPSDTA